MECSRVEELIGDGICKMGKGMCYIVPFMEDDNLIAFVDLPDDQMV